MLSGTYEGQLQDLPAVESQVVRAIAGEVRVTLTAPEEARVFGSRRVSLNAYDAYLRGRHALFRASVEDVRRGIQLFGKALEIDPRYALAYAGIAEGYLSLSGMYMAPHDAMPKARAAAARALEIDPESPDAHVSLGVVRGWYEFAWEKAQEEFRRAIDANPSDASARLWYGQSLVNAGRSHDGIAQVRLAHDLDPLSAFVETGLGQVYFLSRQYESAIRQLRSVTEADPDFVHGHMFLGVAYLYTKQYRDAVLALEKAIQMDPLQPQSLGYLIYAHAKMGDRQTALRYLEKLRSLRRTRYVSGYLFAIGSMGLGTNDAFGWLNKAHEERDDMLAWLPVDAVFDPVRSDPRFRLLLRQVGFFF